MRHRVKTKQMGRSTDTRKQLLKSLVSALIQTGEIKTTESKAKAIKGITDKLVSRAMQGSISARRLLARFFGRRDIVNKLVDEVAPAMKDRNSGFTRIVKVGKRRGDNADMVKIEFVTKPEPRKIEKANKEESKTKKAVVAKAKPSTKKESLEKTAKPKTTK